MDKRPDERNKTIVKLVVCIENGAYYKILFFLFYYLPSSSAHPSVTRRVVGLLYLRK